MSEGPSRIALRDWTCHSHTVLVRPGESLPDAVEAAVAQQPLRAHGYFCVDPAFSAAVYVDEGRLQLQVALQAFDWQRERVEILHRRFGLHECRATVWSNGHRVFRLRYRSVASEAIEAGDMTFDAIDEETTDWWLWLSMFSSSGEFMANMTDSFVRGF